MPDYWTDQPRAGRMTPAERAAHIEAVTDAARPLDAKVRAEYGPPSRDPVPTDVGRPRGRVAAFLAILDAQPVDPTAAVVHRAE